MSAVLVEDLFIIEVDTIDETGHVCGEDCLPCARWDCQHNSCQHEGGNDDPDGECEAHGCLCARFLADGDCSTCDGHGAITDERDRDCPCRDCGATGKVGRLLISGGVG